MPVWTIGWSIRTDRRCESYHDSDIPGAALLATLQGAVTFPAAALFADFLEPQALRVDRSIRASCVSSGTGVVGI